MKKKNLKKLLKNFRPSMEQTKNRLFRELENKALNSAIKKAAVTP